MILFLGNVNMDEGLFHSFRDFACIDIFRKRSTTSTRRISTVANSWNSLSGLLRLPQQGNRIKMQPTNFFFGN